MVEPPSFVTNHYIILVPVALHSAPANAAAAFSSAEWKMPCKWHTECTKHGPPMERMHGKREKNMYSRIIDRTKHVLTYHRSHIVARRALCIILIANGQGRLGIICEGEGLEHVPKSIRTTVLTDEQDLAKLSAVFTWISEHASRGKPKIPLLIAGTHICESNIK